MIKSLRNLQPLLVFLAREKCFDESPTQIVCWSVEAGKEMNGGQKKNHKHKISGSVVWA